MSKLPVLILALLLAASASAQQAPWLGESDDRFIVDISGGAFGDGTNAFSINGEIRTFWDVRVGASATSIEGEPSSTSSQGFYVSSDPYARFVGGLGLSVYAQDQIFTAQDMELNAGWNVGSWYLEGSFVSGEVELEPGSFDEDIHAVLLDLGYLTASRSGFGLATTFKTDKWALRTAFGSYKFTQDDVLTEQALFNALPGLAVSQRTALSEQYIGIGFNHKVLLQYVQVMPQATYQNYRTTPHLVDSEISIDFLRSYSDINVGYGFSWADPILDGEQESISSIYGSADYAVDDVTNFGFLVGTSNADSALYAELNLSYSW
ncbi:MAG: hypothetical protein ACI93R_002619 [Flavobacteriales bacterium]|jgi:hypothetical protein